MNTLNLTRLLLFLLLTVFSFKAAVHAEPGKVPTSKEARERAYAPGPGGLEAHGPTADIDKSCSTAKDKDFCVKTLKASPKSKNADIKELVFLSMEMAQNKSGEIDSFISTKLRNEEAIDDKLDDALNECDDAYDDATAVIEDAISSFFRKSYDDIRKFVTAAMGLGEKCEQEFKDADQKGVIGDKNQVFLKLCGNILALVDAWQKSKE